MTTISFYIYINQKNESKSDVVTDEQDSIKKINNKSQTALNSEVKQNRKIASLKKNNLVKAKIEKNKADSNTYLKIDKKFESLIKDKNEVLKIEALKLERKIHHKKQSVVIINTNHKGMRGSFKALIDDKSGKILQTWARNKSENFFGRETIKFTHPIYK